MSPRRIMASARRRSAASRGKKPKKKKVERSKPEMDSAVTAAQQPGTPTTRMPASMAARISSLPGSEMQGVPASVMTAMLLPC